MNVDEDQASEQRLRIYLQESLTRTTRPVTLPVALDVLQEAGLLQSPFRVGMVAFTRSSLLTCVEVHVRQVTERVRTATARGVFFKARAKWKGRDGAFWSNWTGTNPVRNLEGEIPSPATTDPATCGVLEALLQEASGDPTAHTAPVDGGWVARWSGQQSAAKAVRGDAAGQGLIDLAIERRRLESRP
jgi:hypothetical protein